MLGNIFAISMIAMLLGSIAVLIVVGKRPTLRSSLIGVLVAGISFFALDAITAVHACRRGGTATPELLGAVLAGVVFAAVPHRKIKIPVVVILLAFGYGLTSWGMELVHDTPYVGNPNWPAELDRVSAHSLNGARETVRAMCEEDPGVVLSQGWIEEVWPEATGEDAFGGWTGYTSGTIGYFWHTWFTGIYRLDETRNGIWCPGGPVAECAEKLEIRDRPEPTN